MRSDEWFMSTQVIEIFAAFLNDASFPAFVRWRPAPSFLDTSRGDQPLSNAVYFQMHPSFNEEQRAVCERFKTQFTECDMRLKSVFH
jgi:hypothetical protein